MLNVFRRMYVKLSDAMGALPLALFSIVCFVSTGTRLILVGLAYRDVDWISLPGILIVGAFYDLIAGACIVVLAGLIYLLCPQYVLGKRIAKPVAAILLAAVTYLVLFNAAAEVLFWQEFGARYNFIAVDYLVYTHEVIGNIRESYPVGRILTGLLGLTGLLLWPVRRQLAEAIERTAPVLTRLRHTASWLLLAMVGCLVSGMVSTGGWQNRFNAELAGNGLYSFVAAFRNNELDYAHYYATRPSAEVRQTLGHLIAPDTERVDLPRQISSQDAERRLNVVLISVESLSAEFLGHFGNRQNLTPHLDRLADEGMLFTRLYATGTRTVRGLEALTLSVPPTPGQSIVKRPGNAHLFSLGGVFRSKGYDVRYAYGGYGYFDNMNAFFGNNDYRIVDRLAIPSHRIPFENIWGVADEALFDQVLDEIDESHSHGHLSFTHVMTTSNHRPFTYPEGRIDIPSHSGREGGVKYTDYAIGRFIDMARSKPWFRDTVFVIVADHCASSAGKTELPVARYHIPMIVYAPSHVAPARVDRLASQIDAGPTLLGLLHFNYSTRFVGRDILRTPPQDERAFISTYQSLGYLKNNMLTVLKPRRQVAAYRIDAQSNATPAPIDATLLKEAIAYYQGTSELYKSGQYRSLR